MRIRTFFIPLIAGLLSLVPSLATAAPDPLVLVADEASVPPPATLADAAWMEGHWVGDQEGATTHHVILPPDAGHMPGFVRCAKDGEIWFYEISLLAERAGSLAYVVRHFTDTLRGWEQDGGEIVRPLLALDGGTFWYDGITFDRQDADNFTVYFRITDGEREGEIMVIPFTRYQAATGEE